MNTSGEQFWFKHFFDTCFCTILGSTSTHSCKLCRDRCVHWPVCFASLHVRLSFIPYVCCHFGERCQGFPLVRGFLEYVFETWISRPPTSIGFHRHSLLNGSLSEEFSRQGLPRRGVSRSRLVESRNSRIEKYRVETSRWLSKRRFL